MRKRETNSDYIWWIHSWGCCICKAWPVHAHHTVSKARLGSDLTCIPLCPEHHLGWVHTKGHKTTQAHFKVDFEEQVKIFNSHYENGIDGPFVERLKFMDGKPKAF